MSVVKFSQRDDGTKRFEVILKGAHEDLRVNFFPREKGRHPATSKVGTNLRLSKCRCHPDGSKGRQNSQTAYKDRRLS